ncbi:receptor-type tyrosine-protein phosphatase H-like isoform X5 [Haliotis asinina]|uniref:receptor-type tyrosine-protein phosphatase H-like isoform X5 n=1 Tax=Haliotis asinina TaxID=109174 RepID=UPI0035327966
MDARGHYWRSFIWVSLLFLNAAADSHLCSSCDASNVTCVDGECPHRCVNVTLSGECLKCQDSRFYGKQCQHDCPDTCLNSRCQMNSIRVVCTDGCVDGKKGDNCGVNCPTACTHCERYGDACTGPCQNPQYYGPHCRTPCPSNCRGGCNNVTGECGSCEPGYTGKYCNITCLYNCKDECDKVTGKCRYSDHTSLLIWVGGMMLSAVVASSFLLLLMFLWKRRKRRRLNRSQGKDVTCEMNSLNNNVLKPYDFQQNLSSSQKMYTSSRQDGDLQRVTLCEHLKCDGSSMQLIDEFQRLSSPDIEKAKYGSLGCNDTKNRYRDVLPYDSTRVSLEIADKSESDYINASFIDGYKEHIHYVAAQGPSVEVVPDFWRMIWQLKTTKIVMLTNLVEAGKVKCEMYWPFCSSDCSTYGKVYVQCLEEKVYSNYTLRKLAVWKGHSRHRLIRQFHFTAWPDHGVPGETTSVLDFHRVVKDTKTDSSGPLLIHCSAGIGRTGTFIALDYLLDQAKEEGHVCIYNCVQNLRQQRMKMVQTQEQYAFIYKTLMSALEIKGSSQWYQKPITVLCGDCWRQRKGNSRSNASLEKNDPEYQNLWTCQSHRRTSYLPVSPSPPLEEYAIISETTPPRLHRSLKSCSIDVKMDTWMDTSV